MKVRPVGSVARSAATGVGMVAAGVLLVGGALARSDGRDAAATDRWLAGLDLAPYKPPLVPAVAAAVSDLGNLIPLHEVAPGSAPGRAGDAERAFLARVPIREQLIHQGPADDRANCHGWTFTGGRYWVLGEAVAVILAENGYRRVESPRPGDLAVYWSGAAAEHSAVVRYVAPGMPVLVAGKWGGLGVYLHPADECVYGDAPTFYRSGRPGHRLRGLSP